MVMGTFRHILSWARQWGAGGEPLACALGLRSFSQCSSSRCSSSLLSQSCGDRGAERGATMLEFALAFPLLLLIILTMMDIARVQAVKGALNLGAHEGLHVARTVPNLDIDAHGLLPSSYDYLRYFDAKRKVADAATDIPLKTMLSLPGSGAWAELLSFRHFGDTANENAAVLRPYECARAAASDPLGCLASDSQCLRHEALRDDLDCQPTYIPESFDAYRSEPIVIKLRARVQPILPFVGDYFVEGSAYGFREEIPKAAVDLSAYGVVTPTAVTTTSTTTTTVVTTTSTTMETPLCVADWGECARQSNPALNPLNVGGVAWCPDTSLTPIFGICQCNEVACGLPFGL